MTRRHEVPSDHIHRRIRSTDSEEHVRPTRTAVPVRSEEEEKRDHARLLGGDSRDANGFFAGEIIEIE